MTSLSEVEDSYPELFGVNPRVIAVLMTIITLIVPFGYGTIETVILFDWYAGAGFYGLFWYFGSVWTVPTSGFFLFNPHFLKLTVILSILNILYVFELVRYYQGERSKTRVIVVGLASLLFPDLLVRLSTVLVQWPYFGIIWPIPIQFIVGIILIHKIPGPEFVSTPID